MFIKLYPICWISLLQEKINYHGEFVLIQINHCNQLNMLKDKERFMGLLLIGRFLDGTPYEKTMRRGQATTQ